MQHLKSRKENREVARTVSVYALEVSFQLIDQRITGYQRSDCFFLFF